MPVQIEVDELYPFFSISDDPYLTVTVNLTKEEVDFVNKTMEDFRKVQFLLGTRRAAASPNQDTWE